MRKQGDGSIFFPHRGDPPKCPPGHYVDPNDRWHFIPFVRPCSYRVMRKATCPGCGNSDQKVCDLHNCLATYTLCVSCTISDSKISIPSEVWLAGKGQSLDEYDWSQAGFCRVGINEVAFILPRCYAAIALDPPVFQKYATLPPNIWLVKRNTATQINHPREYIWQFGREVLDKTCTASVAIQVLHYLGAKIVHMVGFDSLSRNYRYADSIVKIGGQGLNTDKYANANKSLLQAIRTTNVKAIFHD